MKTITYIYRGMELKMNHWLVAKKMPTQCTTILKQDKMSINYGEDVNNMFYNPLFWYGSILEDQRNTLSIIELFDDAIGNEIYDKDIEDSMEITI